MTERNKKPHQLKKCDKCSKEFPQLFKTLTIDGVRKKVCQRCASILEATKKKQKVEKAKVKRKEKRERITDKKLHTVVARLVKEIYPLVCHACSKPLVKGSFDTQCCHFVQRSKKICTWDIRNLYPGCAKCNGFVQSHIYELGKKANMYWGEGTAEMLRELETKTFQWSQYQKNQLYELFTHPPQGVDLEHTRKLILEEYLNIKNGS